MKIIRLITLVLISNFFFAVIPINGNIHNASITRIQEAYTERMSGITTDLDAMQTSNALNATSTSSIFNPLLGLINLGLIIGFILGILTTGFMSNMILFATEITQGDPFTILVGIALSFYIVLINLYLVKRIVIDLIINKGVSDNWW